MEINKKNLIQINEIKYKFETRALTRIIGVLLQ